MYENIQYPLEHITDNTSNKEL